MNNPINITRSIRRIATPLLLLTVIVQMTTVILLLTGFSLFNIGEVHEICGLTFFALVILHVILFRKSLKSIFSAKTK